MQAIENSFPNDLRAAATCGKARRAQSVKVLCQKLGRSRHKGLLPKPWNVGPCLRPRPVAPATSDGRALVVHHHGLIVDQRISVCVRRWQCVEG